MCIRVPNFKEISKILNPEEYLLLLKQSNSLFPIISLQTNSVVLILPTQKVYFSKDICKA